MTVHPAISLLLLGRFWVRVGTQVVDLPPSAQRLLAMVALDGGVANRSRIAGTLWPDSPTPRALANLRGALWRIPELVRDHVETRDAALSLSSQWTIDVDLAVSGARRLRESGCDRGVDCQMFTHDLLPDWDEDWLVVPRERHRQLRLHALENLAAAEITAGRPLDAVDTALQAVAAEPLRESAQLLLLRAHLAAGNRAAVVRQFERFRALLDAELRLEPSSAFQAILAQAVACP